MEETQILQQQQQEETQQHPHINVQNQSQNLDEIIFEEKSLTIDCQKQEQIIEEGKTDCVVPEVQYSPNKLQEIENIIEQHQIIDNLNYNKDKTEVDELIEQLMKDDTINDSYKKSLFFIQSDQELFLENMNQLESVASIATNQMQEIQVDLEKYKNLLSEKETELRIMKRERDEYLTQKVEVTLDNKRIKNELEVYQKHFEALEGINSQQNHQQPINTSQQVHPVIDQQSKLSKLIPSLFGVGKKQQISNQQEIQQQQVNNSQRQTHQRTTSSLQLQMHPGIPHIQNSQQQQPKIVDEQFENEQKEVIQIMQDQIQMKIKELQKMQQNNDESNIELGRVKGMLAREKERSEDLSSDLEINNMRLKKVEEQLQLREKEVETLKQELLKVRTTSEQEIKKLKKAQQNSGGTAANMTTGGSNEIMSARIHNQSIAYDPYSSGGRVVGGGIGYQPNLNQSVLADYHNVLNSQRDTLKSRESIIKSFRQKQDKPSIKQQDMNQSVIVGNSGISTKIIDLNNSYQVSSYDNPFEQSTASSTRGGTTNLNNLGSNAQNNFSSNNSSSLFNSNGPVRSRLFGQKNTNNQNNSNNLNINQMAKKITKTKKYEHVEASIKTGRTVKDVEVLSDKLVAKRANEKYKRIKCSTLAKLLGGNNLGESVYNWKGEEGKEEFKGTDMISDTESIYSMRSSMSQQTSITVATDQLGITAETQFLLLDMREPELYRKWHIRDSINYYHILLNQDKTIPEIYRFRNQPNKMIIIYLDDERTGTEIATKLVEKGFENSFLLSGGIEKFLEEFTDLVEGTDVPVPVKKLKEEKDKKKKMRSTQVGMRHQDCKKDHH
eukprot:403370035